MTKRVESALVRGMDVCIVHGDGSETALCAGNSIALSIQDKMSTEGILQRLGVTETIPDVEVGPYKIILHPAAFIGKESDFQDWFNEQNRNSPYLAVNSFKSSAGLSFFMPLEDSNVTRSAKPDVVSTALPLIMEFKASGSKIDNDLQAKDWEVLAQCMDRILAQSAVFGYLSRFITIAFTNRAAWILSYSQLPEDGYHETSPLREKIFIAGVDPSTVSDIWAQLAYHAAYNGYEYYMVREAPLILRALRALKLNVMSARVILAGQSMSRVFRVKIGIGNTIGSSDYDFALKVIMNTEQFEHEANICEIMHSRTAEANTKPDFYVFGKISADGDCQIWRHIVGVTEQIASEVTLSPLSLDSALQCWWTYDDVKIMQGGILCMDYGCSWDDASQPDIDTMVTSIYMTFHLMHDVAPPIVHRDIRKSNLLLIRANGI